MAQVLGIGGIFFKADDKAAVEDWYRRVLGFDIQKWGGAMFKPADRAYQVWTPFAADTKHFEPSTHPFMVNLMVDDLDGVLEKAKGGRRRVAGSRGRRLRQVRLDPRPRGGEAGALGAARRRLVLTPFTLT